MNAAGFGIGQSTAKGVSLTSAELWSTDGVGTRLALPFSSPAVASATAPSFATTITGMVYSPDLAMFVAWCNTQVQYSYDGLTWASVVIDGTRDGTTGVPTYTWNSGAWFNGAFYLYSGGTCIRSTDGVNFTKTGAYGSPTIGGVVPAVGAPVMMSNTGKYSTDGQSWNASTGGTFNSVVWTGGYFLGALTSGTTLYSSVDGTSWTSAGTAPLTLSAPFLSLGANGAVFLRTLVTGSYATRVSDLSLASWATPSFLLSANASTLDYKGVTVISTQKNLTGSYGLSISRDGASSTDLHVYSDASLFMAGGRDKFAVRGAANTCYAPVTGAQEFWYV